MSNILFRTAELTPGTGRQVFGTVVPYEEVVDINMGGPEWDYQEKFVLGAFARSIVERGNKVKLMTAHDHRRLPVGRAVELREEAKGLFAAFEIAQTRDGDDALELVKSGTVDAFSIGFRPIRDRQERGVTVRVEAALMEVSLVAVPAYSGAAISGVRSEHLLISRGLAEARLSLLDW